MIYTVRFAHLESKPRVRVGDLVVRGQALGRMGSTGQSTAAHLHLDVVEGARTDIYRLEDIEAGDPAPAPIRQANWFIAKDDVKGYELFLVKPLVTTPIGELEYFEQRGKVHYHYDVVPEDRKVSDRHYMIHWPRSMSGVVSAVHYDAGGYGHVLYVQYEA
jgi:murein DD-endopeptidase MepM/ murein hydrolase activator NlpD